MEEYYDKIVMAELERWTRHIEIESALIGTEGQDCLTARGWKDHGQSPLKICLGWQKRFLGKPYRCFHVSIGGIAWRTMPMKMSNGWRRESVNVGYETCPATTEDLHKTMLKLCGRKHLIPSPPPEFP